MITVTPDNLHQEATAAVEFNRKHTQAMDAMVMDMVASGGYRSDLKPVGAPVYENIWYEFVTNAVPALAFNCPKVQIGEAYPAIAEDQVQAETAALNQCGLDNRMGVLLRRIAVDRCFGFGVVKTTMSDSPSPSGFMWPKASRVRPRDFIMDPLATHEDDARWFGEIIEADKDDLLKMPGFDAVAVSQMAEDEKDSGDEKTSVPARRRVKFYEIFMVEDRMLYCIAASMTGEKTWLRQPRAYVGHKRGPYVLFGHLPVPDRPIPLSELGASKMQADELNLHATQIASDAGTAKRMMAYDKSQPELGEKIVKGENGTTLGVDGDPRQALMPVEWGGPQAANLEYSEILKQRLNRMLGITDTRRGEVDPNATATADSIAEQGTSRREQFSRAVFQEQVGQVYSRLLSLMRKSRQVRRSLVIGGGDDGEKVGGMFIGGGDPHGLNSETDSEVKIEPYSMEYTSEGMLQRRAMQVTEIITNTAPIARQFPEWNWSKVIDDQMNALNVSGGGERYLDSEMLMMFQGAMTGAVPPGASGAPVMGDPAGGPVDEQAALLAAASREN